MSYYSANQNSIKSGRTQNTRTLGYPAAFGGVDLSAPPRTISQNRFADALNMWKDYHDEEGACIQTFPGWRQLRDLSAYGTINGIFRYNEYIMVHAGTKLLAFLHSSRDTSTPVEVGTGLANRKSSGFVSNNVFYILDGDYYRYADHTTGSWQFGQVTARAYVPQLYASHTPTVGTGPDQYEQRNMLTQLFKESWVVGEDEVIDITAPDCAEFKVDSNDKMTCVVTSKLTGTGTTWYIPGSRRIDGNTYQVKRVGRFTPNTSVTTLIIGEGVEEISDSAFYGFTGLTTIVLPGTLRYVGSNAFGSAPNTLTVYLDVCGTDTSGSEYRSLLKINGDAFGSYNHYHGTVRYVGSEDGLDEIKYDDTSNQEYFNSSWWTRVCNASRYAATHRKYIVPLTSPLYNLASVYISGAQIGTGTTANTYYQQTTYDGHNALMVAVKSDDALLAKTITVTGTLREGYFTIGNNSETYQSCINHCTKAVEYDGRIFFFGNPKFPNIVWYTQRDLQAVNRAEYVGELNYWQDGAAGAENVSALATGSYLCMFSRTTDGSGGVFLHTGTTSESNLTPRLYPSEYGSVERAPYAACCSFFDDPIYLTARGVDAIAKQQVNLERSVAHRSSNVDAKLTAENLAGAIMVEWDGYALIVCPSGRVYMADSRQMFTHAEGDAQYEWYILDGFSGVTSMLSTGNILYFGKSGKLYVVNTDKRSAGGQIPATWYSRAGAPIETRLITRYDDCGYPHVNKNTVYKSVDVELKCESIALPEFSWRSDRNEQWSEESFGNLYGIGTLDFGNAEERAVKAHVYVSDEHMRLWIFKQYKLSSKAVGAPWGIYHISYRWHVCRRIKNL